MRKVITNLLQGLRGKQTAYRKIISEQKHRSSASGHPRHESRSSVRSSRRDAANSQKSLHRNNPDAGRISGPSLERTVTSSRQNSSRHGIDSLPRPPLVEESDDGGFVDGSVAPPQPPSIRDINDTRRLRTLRVKQGIACTACRYPWTTNPLNSSAWPDTFMNSPNLLQQLHDLYRTSPQFHKRFVDFLRGNDCQDIPSLQNEDSTWLVEYLGGVSLQNTSLRSALNAGVGSCR